MNRDLYATWTRVAIIGGILLALMAGHWLTLTDMQSSSHAIHALLQKLFFVPVILGALWFNLRGSLLTCAAITLLYLPYVLIAWKGEVNENIDQLAQIGTVWLGGILFGVLFQREKDRQEKLLRIHEGALIALVSALDAREHDTQQHSLRVQAYALRLARDLDMTEDELLSLSQGALLHDIGKIGIPDSVLLKAGPLTDSEWDLMREHPTIGRSILENADSFYSATDIVFSHHEKYDGSGYPRGLKGEQISLGARIFSLVDAFDAITSKRPYEEEVPFHEALTRLKASSGEHFDPAIVDLFVSIKEEEWKAISDRIASGVSRTEAHPVPGPA